MTKTKKQRRARQQAATHKARKPKPDAPPKKTDRPVYGDPTRQILFSMDRAYGGSYIATLMGLHAWGRFLG